MLVRFIARSGVYFPGEVADFDKDRALALIRARAADEHATATPNEAPRVQDEVTRVPRDETPEQPKERVRGIRR